ncbi:MAG TPA: site-specific integrase [Terriglobales bacterium]|nr:site-specific integrase [Terriglobales bacterium]
MLQRNQKGYVYKRGSGKVWYGRYREDALTPDGKVIRRARNVRLGTIKELPSRAAAVVDLQGKMAVQKLRTVLTFSDLFERWKLAELATMKPSTARYYQKLLRAHVLPIFGNMEISNINREDVQVFLAEQAPKYSKNTLRGMRVSLGKVLSWAVDCGWLEKNPCSKIKLPDAGKEKTIHKPLKSSEVIAIAEKLEEPYSTLVLFLAITGLRIGEAIGIKWSDFDGEVLHISRTIYEGKLQSPKTKKSVRSLPIPASLLARMRNLGAGDFVFRSHTGTPVNPGNALKRYVRPVAEGLGIELGGWHDFRRTAATRMLRRGESAKLVSNMLGNSVEVLLKDYDLPEVENFRMPLAQAAELLLPTVTKPAPAR